MCGKCFSKYISSVEDSLHTNVKHFWTYVSNKKDKPCIPAKVHYKDTTATEPEVICDVFSNFFHSVYEPASPLLSQWQPPTETSSACDIMSTLCFNEENILRELRSLDPAKSSGPDGIPAYFLRRTAAHICKPLAIIYNNELEADDKIKSELSTRCQTLLNRLESKEDIEVHKDEITSELKQVLHETLGDIGDNIVRKLQFDTEYNNNEEDLEETKPKLFKTSTVDIEFPKRKLVPISQWGVYFSADTKISVNAFIERVNEIKEARNATDEDLWRYAIDFFKGDALIWFRANKVQATNWKELVILLKRTFQSPFYQDDLLTEIKARTQGKDESVTIYMSILQNMFNRLPSPITEQEKISIVLRNIQPYYQKAICRDVFFSVSEIVDVLRIIERTKINCDRFEEPRVQKINLEPDLAYKNNYSLLTKNVNEFEKKIEIDNVTSNAQRTITGRCWNCREVGHLFRSCRIPKQRLFCYKCGRFGVTSKDCVCKGNAAGESTKPAK
ncbi:hypothetical protein HW555_001191 [Spodoptera exigua]|uniref:CCHC-type domain-containing protein n=1 Tax=Spodoptera exigua TaxID=7107 RepID=A0A835GSF8_SPOEX|nr:hypothetical protein HW555_001191 [Spodoptera exigua]